MNKADKSYTELKKLVMQKFYNKDPTAMPIKEVKPLRFNRMVKFAAKVETDVDIIGNAAVELIKVIEGN
jgi:hypothetical protein